MYHAMFKIRVAKKVLGYMDHSMIYVLIAGRYVLNSVFKYFVDVVVQIAVFPPGG